jgi:hypothetical protein
MWCMVGEEEYLHSFLSPEVDKSGQRRTLVLLAHKKGTLPR